MTRFLTPANSLQSLPNELIGIILDSLDYPSKIALQWTSKSLYLAMKGHGLAKTCNMVDLLKIERWPNFSMGQLGKGTKQPVPGLDFFACHICCKIRSAVHFSNAMMKGHRGKLSPVPSRERASRFCIPCGVNFDRYPVIQYGGTSGGDGIVCCKCGYFREVERDDVEFKRRMCRTCRFVLEMDYQDLPEW